MLIKDTVLKSIRTHVCFNFFVTIRKGSDHFIVETVRGSNIIVAVKKTDGHDGYPTYDTVYYQLNQGQEATCSISHKNQTHDICKIVAHRLATRFMVRLRTCRKLVGCTDYSSWQTVWTLPPSKQTPQLMRVNSALDRADIP